MNGSNHGLSSDSAHGLGGSSHGQGHGAASTVIRIRSVLIEVENDDVIEDDDFEDSRLELRNAGHNLTAVLVNPRESIFDTFTDEFAMDQSEPLDISYSGGPASSSSSTVVVGGRNIRQIGPNNPSSGSILDSHSINSSTLPSFNSPQEIEDLNRLVVRMKRMFVEYVESHGPFSFTPPSAVATGLMSPRSPRIEKGFSFSSDSIKHTAYSIRGSASRESSLARLAAQEAVLACYKEVPDLFFRNDFSLHVADTFTKALVPVNADTQESLSRYLDLVETALLKQIWVRSGAFFRALDDIKGLRGLVSETINHVSDLKGKIHSLDDNLTVSALRIPALQRRRVNENALQSKLLAMQKVMESKKTVRMLLDVDDYVGALQIIDSARRTYDTELIKLVSMARLGRELTELHTLIGEVMSGKFVSAAIQWDDDDNGLGMDGEDGNQLLSDSETDRLADTSRKTERQSHLNEQLQGLMRSLLATGRLRTSLKMYESRLCDSVILIIRTCVLEYISNFDPLVSAEIMNATKANDNSDGNHASDAILGQRVRNMSIDNFIACITMVFEHVMMALKRSHRVHVFMKNSLSSGAAADSITTEPAVEVIATPVKSSKYQVSSETNTIDRLSSSIGSHSPCAGTNNNDSLVNISKECLVKAGSLAQRSIVELFSTRKDSTSRMKADNMKVLWQTCSQFITEFEELGGGSAYSLRQALNQQTKVFLENIHAEHKNNFSNKLSLEKWSQVDVSADRQTQVDRLTSGKSFLLGAGLVDKSSTPHSSDSSTSIPAASSSQKKKELKPVVVDNSNYKVVYSGLLLVEITMVYLDIAASFPLVASDVIDKIVDIHEFFDSRTRSLVLGAQAINPSTGLKSISAKHLAVTAQTIQLVQSLLPHVRAALIAVISPANQVWLTKLDRTSSMLLEHHGLIVGKFVSIVSDSVDISAQKLKGVDWDRFQGQCEYFEEVSKNVATLHRVLLEVLPPELMQEIFSRIFNALSRKMPSHFEDIMPTTETGKQRILDEVTHIISGFSRLKLIDSTGPTSLLDDTFRRRYGR